MNRNKILDIANLKKSEWGPGPWQSEPDRLEWRYLGFPCLMVRNMHVTGTWCGYVAVTSSHPYYGKEYPALDVSIHGGLTYSNKCQGDICHIPRPGEPDDVWWLGFDCGHCTDLFPKMEAFMQGFLSKKEKKFLSRFPMDKWLTYKDVHYVKKEVNRLARQLKAVKA